MPNTNRSAGITIIAILQFLGSALLLAMAAFMAFAMIVAPTPPQNDAQLPPIFIGVLRVVLPLFYALPAVWGIVTAIGLLQLKNWARISAIIISVLLIAFGAFGMLTSMVFFLKPPPGNGVDPKMFSIIGAVTAAMSLAQIGIGIWWMVFFNRARVKAQFLAEPLAFPPQSADPYAIDPRYSTLVPPPGFPASTDVALLPTPPIAAPQRTARPLSISIIAWFMLVSCLFIPVNIVFHSPSVLFTAILTGWPAVIFLMVFGALNLYTGIALLKMKPSGWLVGMGYYLFALLNFGVFYLAPGRSARIAKLMNVQQSMFPWMRSSQANFPFDSEMMPVFIVTGICVMVFFVVMLYVLAAAKPAFDNAAREQAG